jgi:hypothetical protein
MTGSRRIVISTVVLLIAGAVVTMVMLTVSRVSSAKPASSLSPTMSDKMRGMDHGSGMPASSPSPTMASDMPGMDHGSGMPASSPSPTSSGDSPWKTHDDSGTGAHEHGSGDSPANTDDNGSGDMPGMDHGTMAGTTKDRPLAPVLGTFGGGTSAVLLSAGFLRRKDRAQRQAKQAVRAARRTQK